MEDREIRKRVLKMNKRKFKVTNSNGIKEAWRWIKKNKWLNIGCPISEKDFGIIVKAINLSLQDQLLDGKDILFLNRMGRVEVRRYKAKVELKDGRVVTNLPIDWKKTKELWAEDKEAEQNKTLIRYENPNVFSIYYNKSYANYANKGFYQFTPTRTLKKRLGDKILTGRFDALLLEKRNELY